MSGLSVPGVAFAGFGLVARKPILLAALAAVYLVFALGLAALLIGQFGADAARLQEMGRQGDVASDPLEALRIIGRLAPFYAASMAASVVAYAIMGAAVYRATLRPAEHAPHYLGLGADEARQMALIVVMSLLFLALYVGFAVCAMLLVSIATAIAAGAGAAPAAGGGGVSALALGVAAVAVCAGLTIFAVRLSLAGPLTFAQRRLRIFESWRLTARCFWTLFGAYLLIVLTVALVLAFGAAAWLAAQGGFKDLTPETLSARIAPDMRSFNTYFTAPTLVLLGVGAWVYALLAALLLAPAAHAYRLITASR